jgi:hypothetical protein
LTKKGPDSTGSGSATLFIIKKVQKVAQKIRNTGIVATKMDKKYGIYYLSSFYNS